MAPPKFDDLSKSAQDLFTKGYAWGTMKIDHKLLTASGLEFKTTATQNMGSGELSAAMDLKYIWPKYGVTLIHKLNTNSAIGTEISVQDQYVKGLKLILDTSMNPVAGKRAGKVKAEFAEEWVNTNLILDMNSRILTLSGVFACKQPAGFLFASSFIFDGQNAKLQRHKFALGYHGPGFALNSSVTDSTDFGADIYHRPAADLEVGVQLGWTRGNPEPRFGLASVYKLNNDTTFRAKLNNNSQIGLGVTHTLKRGLKLSLSGLLNTQNLNAGHQFGVGLEFEQ